MYPQLHRTRTKVGKKKTAGWYSTRRGVLARRGGAAVSRFWGGGGGKKGREQGNSILLDRGNRGGPNFIQWVGGWKGVGKACDP